MASSHKLSQHDQWFLSKGLCDPVTKQPFVVGDSVVICAHCKVPHRADTWGLNEAKRCASCQGNVLLEFDEFAPKILRPKAVHTAGFRMVGERLSLEERLGQVNGYPWAYAMMILIPLLIAVTLFRSAYLKGIQPLDLAQHMGTAALVMLEQMVQTVAGKLSELADHMAGGLLHFVSSLAAGVEHAVGKFWVIPAKLFPLVTGLVGVVFLKVQWLFGRILDVLGLFAVKLFSAFSKLVYQLKQKLP